MVNGRPIIAIGYFTGMRLDIYYRLIDLEVPDTKDKEARSIPINKELLNYFETIPRGLYDAHVFLYRGKPIKDVRTGSKSACEKAGILYGQKVNGGFVFMI